MSINQYTYTELKCVKMISLTSLWIDSERLEGNHIFTDASKYGHNTCVRVGVHLLRG